MHKDREHPDEQTQRLLETLLSEYGFGHEALAEKVNHVCGEITGKPGNVTDRDVRRWTSGEVRWPTTRYLLALARIFDRPPEAMGFIPRGKSSRLPNLPAMAPAVDRKEESPMQRRGFFTASAAATLAAALGIDQTPTGGRLGLSDVDRINSTITRLDAHFNGLGGGALIDVAVNYLQRLQHALDYCTYGERVERAMHRAVAEVGACAGWSAHDCGRYDQAAQLRNTALQAALLARDPVAVTRAWSDLAAQAEHARHPAEAARINRAALAERHLRAHPLLSSLLHARLADCLAQTNDPQGMGRHLAAAERAYDRASPNGVPSWLAFLTPAELSGLGAIAHESASQYGRAEQQAQQTLDLLEDRFTRNRTYYTVLLAELQLAQGDRGHAAKTASGIQTDQIASSRITVRLARVITAASRPRGGCTT